MCAFAPWQAATRCSGSASPGARALMKHVLDTTPGARSLGIYSCRAVRGGGTRSIHSEGRALDVGMPMSGGRGSKAGHALVRALIPVASKLGVQAIIYDRKIWSARSPKGRAYNGVNPHYDHLHIEMTRSAAAKLNLATVRAILGAKAPGSKPAQKSSPKKLPVLSKGDRHELVPVLKRTFGIENSDDLFGAALGAKVREYQRKHGLKVDAVVGKSTWSRILPSLDLPGWRVP